LSYKQDLTCRAVSAIAFFRDRQAEPIRKLTAPHFLKTSRMTIILWQFEGSDAPQAVSRESD
jgi:hypothetical protein